MDDLAFAPERTGTADVNDALYILRFKTGAGSSLLFLINRLNTHGTRALIREDGTTVEGPGGFDQIVCKSYDGEPQLAAWRPSRPWLSAFRPCPTGAAEYEDGPGDRRRERDRGGIRGR